MFTFDEAKLGSDEIKNGMTILLYCYSKTVISALIYAKNEGKKFMVIVSETRPNCTGKMTAEDLKAADIRFEFYADIAAFSQLPRVDIVLIGADKIIENGSIVNKYGTSLLAKLAQIHGVPVYCITKFAKFSPEMNARDFIIEYRDPTCPAYDLTQPEYVKAVISELGILAPQKFVEQSLLYIKKGATRR